MNTAFVANYLFQLQPLSIRRRLKEDVDFISRFQIDLPIAVTVGGSVRVDERKLFAAARRALATRQDCTVEDVEGRPVSVIVRENEIRLMHERDNQAFDIGFSELCLLSPRREERQSAAQQILRLTGPTGADLPMLSAESLKRGLNDDEMAKVLSEVVHGVSARQARAQKLLESDRATLSDLVPSEISYYARFCGPPPDDMDPDAYITHTLQLHRKELLRRDLRRGLDICLVGALRDDLLPTGWVQQVGDDDLWEALVFAQPARNPFSLLAAIDIALGRQHDERYLAFARDALIKILQPTLDRPDGLDCYELLSIWVRAALNRISLIEGAMAQPPFWRRMCAWMQAGFLARITHDMALDIKSLREWADGIQSPAGLYASFLDLQREPMHWANNTNAAAMRTEILARLAGAISRHKEHGRSIPIPEEQIQDGLKTATEEPPPFAWALPGPLEGFRRQQQIAEGVMPPEGANKAVEELTQDPLGTVWSSLAYLSQLFVFDKELMNHARYAVGRITPFSAHVADPVKLIERLTDAALVAAAQRDDILAKGIVDAARHAARTASSEQIWQFLRLAIIASAAFEQKEAWAKFLRENLADLAATVPRDPAAHDLLTQLRELKIVLPASLFITSQAEAVVAAC